MFSVWKRRKGVVFVDLLREGTLRPGEYAEDGFHPSVEGYRRWAAIFVAARSRVLRS
jgi:lysophospholipase L1-like esterase